MFSWLNKKGLPIVRAKMIRNEVDYMLDVLTTKINSHNFVSVWGMFLGGFDFSTLHRIEAEIIIVRQCKLLVVVRKSNFSRGTICRLFKFFQRTV